MDRCSKRFSVKNKNVAGWKRQLFVFVVIIMLLMAGTLFSAESQDSQEADAGQYDTTSSDSIPWSTEVKMVSFLNSPSDLYLNIQNIKGLDSSIDGKTYQRHVEMFFRELSLAYNIEVEIIERFFQSDIILFWNREPGYDDHYVIRHLFSLESLISVIRDSLANGAICVRNFKGLKTFIREFSQDENRNEKAGVNFREVNGYLFISGNREVIENFSGKISSRSAFAEDILYYNVESGRTTEIINAYSFLNIERKQILDQSAYSYLDIEKLRESNLSNYIDLPGIQSLKITTTGNLKSFFYNRFLVVRSSEEWEGLFNQLSACSTAFVFLRTEEHDGIWRLVFVLEEYERFKAFWQKKTEEWHLNEETENDNMIMTLEDNVFIISNNSDKKRFGAEANTVLFEKLLEIADQGGVVETGYQKMNELTLFSFIKIDDTIEREVLRIYGDL